METTAAPYCVPYTLNPDYRVAAGVAVMGLVGAAWSWPLGLALVGLAAFLAWQTTTLRWTFTETAVVLTRYGQTIRTFPYADWRDWSLFWPGVPVVLFFREVHSIHFVPVLFDPVALTRYLTHYCPATGAR
ncbi:MAG: DUF3119 family protein [Gloeomargarita sp. SKYBB_i_bin120]|nr:DUF3119 family protein [Gloeomargarita sp. SKYG98]MCS7293492.1 DUF3119 family protein [Gloeomargarita sp. SKYB120]MDW8179058.1 DUF3119 family protein [Gloeomargarita sp. SKYBB_i_bin120]